MTIQHLKGGALVVVLTALAAWIGTGPAQARDYPNGYDPASGLTWDQDFDYDGGLNPYGVVNFDFRRAALFPESYANQGMGYNAYYNGALPPTYYPAMSYTEQPLPAQGYSYGAYAPAQDNEARLRVVVPPDAKIWIDNTATRQTGAVRNFESPPLTPGKQYSYDIKAQWRDQNGKEVTRTRQVDVRANAAVHVDFTRQ